MILAKHHRQRLASPRGVEVCFSSTVESVFFLREKVSSISFLPFGVVFFFFIMWATSVESSKNVFFFFRSVLSCLVVSCLMSFQTYTQKPFDTDEEKDFERPSVITGDRRD